MKKIFSAENHLHEFTQILFARGLNLLFAFCSFFFISYAIGPAEQGKYGLLLSTCIIISIFFRAGLDQAALVSMVSHQTKSTLATALNTIFFVVFGLCFIVFLTSWVTFTILANGVIKVDAFWALFSIFCVLWFLRQFLRLMVIGAGLQNIVNTFSIIQSLTFLMLMGAFYSTGVFSINIILLSMNASLLILNFVFLYKIAKKFNLTIKFSLFEMMYLRKLVKTAGWLFLSEVSFILIQRASPFILASSVDAVTTGLFVFAVSIAEKGYNLAESTYAHFFKIIAKAMWQNNNVSKFQLTIFLVSVYTLIFGFIAFIGETVIEFLPQYKNMLDFFYIILCSMYFFSLSGFIKMFLMNNKQYKEIFAINSFSLILLGISIIALSQIFTTMVFIVSYSLLAVSATALLLYLLKSIAIFKFN